ncbi:unnamed protein product [Brugia pahangi]|uniref:Odorant-binding protein n=1 Tax=Brugia pahangi TaxID=6280 RepID=A0A0N4TPH3_BRUPA|nr:unnamed protein product [Brugia pahangi]
MVLLLFAMLCHLFTCDGWKSKCDQLEVENFPPFVWNLSRNGTEDYCNLYEEQRNISRCQFHCMLQEFGRKYNILESVNKFIGEEMIYENERNEILTKRLQNINGTVKAKKFLFEIIKLQQNMDFPLVKIQQLIDNITTELSVQLQQEAVNLWNAICPDNINDKCPLNIS